MSKAKRVVLIGAGNVAWHLGPALKKKGYRIVQVFSRSKAHAAALARKTGGSPVADLRQLAEADIYLIMLKDDAVLKAAKALRTGALVLHTSGSLGLDVIRKCSPKTGVLYPLQTFSKNEPVLLNEVPMCLEASDVKTMGELSTIAFKLSRRAYKVDSTKRRILHLAAVFACNFSNHLYGLAEKLMKKEGLPFYMLSPLITETVRKASQGKPLQVQTGPAVRGDRKTMQKHLDLLKGERELQKLYRLLSASIMRNKA